MVATGKMVLTIIKGMGGNLYMGMRKISLVISIWRMPGRPKKKRIVAPEEKDDRTKRLSKVGIKMKCSNCGQDGHNKRSCSNSTVIRPDVEKRRVGRPSKSKTAAQNNHQAAQTSSTSRAPITFRERAAARRGIGVYTSVSTGNVYYHSSMTQQRVVHLNRRASMRSSSTRQQDAQHEVPMTQESRNVNDGSS